MRSKQARPSTEAVRIIANGGIVALFLFPLLWMIAGAFKSEGDLLSPDPVWFFSPVLDHWRFIFANWSVEDHLVNSAIISIATTIATLALGFPAAYGLSRFPLWRKDAILFDILSLKMIPPIASAVPLFILAKQVGLYNTHLVLIILNTAFQLPFTLLVLRSFIDEIPQEIDEAARIDGCSALGVMWHAVLPLAVPGLVCCALFVFIFTWNEFLLANVMVGGAQRPLPPIVGLALTHRGILWGPALALGVVVVAPVLALSLMLSRYMTRGLTFGAVKG
jgi:multiple sugar transport system permease protein